MQPKLIDLGWSSEDDSSLAEYIILMLVNGKTQDQVASELSSDLLPDETGTVDFAKWLFDQVSMLRNGSTQNANASNFTSHQHAQAQSSSPNISALPGESAGDAEMGEAANSGIGASVYVSGSWRVQAKQLTTIDSPTGPKAMRGARTGGRGGSGRMVGQINKAMDRGADSILHRVKSQTGTERVSSHGREPPRGPKGSMPRNLRGSMGRLTGALGTPNLPATNGIPQGPMATMSPQQQMQFMAMMEQQASMLAQLTGMAAPAINPSFQNGSPAFQNGTPQPQQGRSLFDRIEPKHRNGSPRKQNQNGRPTTKSIGEDTTMDLGENNAKREQDPSSSMEVESSQNQGESGHDAVCHFNLKCTRKDCPYAHQSPAAPEGTAVDVSDICPFGAACKNFKCTGRHPSPAQKASFQADEQCKFWPYCTNTKCSFKHPTMPMCRNGADCSVPHCKFTHLQTPCKFNPCLNPKCPYKHGDGQRGSYADRVWTADGSGTGNEGHVSERKFVDDEHADEELIKPVEGAEEAASKPTEVIT